MSIQHTQVILDKSSQKRNVTPPSPPTVENMKFITRGRNVMKKEETRRKEKNKKRTRKETERNTRTNTQVILDKSSQKRKITPPSPPTVKNMKCITHTHTQNKKTKPNQNQNQNQN